VVCHYRKIGRRNLHDCAEWRLRFAKEVSGCFSDNSCVYFTTAIIYAQSEAGTEQQSAGGQRQDGTKRLEHGNFTGSSF